jgi:hypothetical protein
MEKPWISKNKEWQEKLRKFVSKVTDEELELVIYKEGWTIAVMLGHLAFWDERRLALIKSWQQNGVEPSDIIGIDMNTINDALISIFLTMPSRRVAELAIKAAEKIDKEVAGLPDDLVQKIQALGDRHALDRGHHRKMHLDEIEAFLKTKRKN